MRTKIERYGAAGRVMAETADRIGLGPIDHDLWAGIMGGIADYDDVSEAAQGQFNNPEVLLTRLGLDTGNHRLRHGAMVLATSSDNADNATNLDTHFRYRALEAKSCVDLLRHSDPATGNFNQFGWEQLDRVAIAGTYLDDVMDATSDASRMPQFTPRQLAYGAMGRFLQTRNAITAETWRALTVAGFKHDRFRQFSKVAITTASLARVTFLPSLAVSESPKPAAQF